MRERRLPKPCVRRWAAEQEKVMPDEKHIASGASSDSRGEEIDKATALPAESSTSAGKDDNGKGQSDTGRADQTDDKAVRSDEAKHDAFDPDEEQA
jgi:hypothetical protein